jgi:four helix bundle protein
MIAYGSLREVETQLRIANRLNYLTQAAVDPLLESTAEIGRLINGLKRSLK